MARYNRINLDGEQHIVSAPAGVELAPGSIVNLVSGEFQLAANGAARMYAVHTSDLSTSADDAIAAAGNVNGDKCLMNRTFALRLAAAQTVALDAELFVDNGELVTAGAAGEGQFWANEALTSAAGETPLISVTRK